MDREVREGAGIHFLKFWSESGPGKPFKGNNRVSISIVIIPARRYSLSTEVRSQDSVRGSLAILGFSSCSFVVSSFLSFLTLAILFF